jgi:hypothetical protein
MYCNHYLHILLISLIPPPLPLSRLLLLSHISSSSLTSPLPLSHLLLLSHISSSSLTSPPPRSHLLFLAHISSSSLTSPLPLSHLLLLSHISSSSCSQRIYKKYAGDKNVIIVEGDHNSNRPKVLYDQATLFLVHILQVCGVLCCTVLFGYWCALFWIDLVGFLPSTIFLLLFLSSPLLAIF